METYSGEKGDRQLSKSSDKQVSKTVQGGSRWWEGDNEKEFIKCNPGGARF